MLVIASSWSVLRDSTTILLESAPPGMDAGEIGSAMVGVPGVQEVHDLHVWTITSGFPSLSAHVLVPEGDDCHAVRRRLEAMLSERFGLTHDAAGRARRRARPSRLDRARDAPRDASSASASERRRPLGSCA